MVDGRPSTMDPDKKWEQCHGNQVFADHLKGPMPRTADLGPTHTAGEEADKAADQRKREESARTPSPHDMRAREKRKSTGSGQPMGPVQQPMGPVQQPGPQQEGQPPVQGPPPPPKQKRDFAAERRAAIAAENRAKDAYQAMRGVGTDEDKLMDSARSMTPEQLEAQRRAFKSISGGESLEGWQKAELGKADRAIMEAYQRGDHALGARLEIDRNISFWGNDPKQIEKILRTIPPEELKAIRGSKSKEWAGTIKKLEGNMKGYDHAVMEALVNNNPRRADAIRLYETINKARDSGDHDLLHDTLAGIDPKNMDAVAAEFAKFKGVRGAVKLPKGATGRDYLSAYSTRTIKSKSYFSSDKTVDRASKFLADAIVKKGADSVEARAAKFKRELDRPGGPDKLRTEQALYVPEGLKQRMHSPDPDVRKAAEAEVKADRAQFEREFKTLSRGWSTEKALNKERLGGDVRNMYKTMLKHGYNSPEVAARQIHVAVTGAGTDEKAIARALRGMNKKEIATTKRAYKLGTGDNLEKRLGIGKHKGWFTELSGQDRIDVELAMMGDQRHMDDDQRMEVAKKKYDTQKGSESTMIGRAVMGSSYENKGLEQNMQALKKFRETHKSQFQDGKFTGSPEDYEKYREHCRHVGITAALYQEQSDRVADGVTTGIAVTGAAVATVASGGTAAPILIAAATGTGTMATNAAMKGGRYGWEDAAADGGTTLVNMASAGAAGQIAGNIDEAYKLGKIGTATMITQKALVEGGKVGTQTMGAVATRDETWDEGVGKGMQKTLYEGGKSFAAGAAGAFAKDGLTKLQVSKSGIRLPTHQGQGTLEKMAQIGNATTRTQKAMQITKAMGTNAGLNAVEGVVNKSTEVSLDAVTGQYTGDFTDAMAEIGTEGLKSGAQGIMETAGGVAKDAYVARRQRIQQQKLATQAQQTGQEVTQATETQAESRRSLEQTRVREGGRLENEVATTRKAHVKEGGKDAIDPAKAKPAAETKKVAEESMKRVEAASEEVNKTARDQEVVKKKAVDDLAEAAKTMREGQEKLTKVTEEDATVRAAREHKERLAKDPDAPTTHKDYTPEEVEHHLKVMMKRGTLSEEAYTQLKKDFDTKSLGKVVEDEFTLQSMIDLRASGSISEKDIDGLLGMPATERRKAIDNLHQAQHLQSEHYPPKLVEAIQTRDPQMKRKLLDETVDFFDKPGQQAAVEALQSRMKQNPKEAMQLAHDLGVFHSMLTRPTRALSDSELKSMVNVHAALAESTETGPSMMRKFMSRENAVQMANNGKYSDSIKGYVADAKNTQGMTPEGVVHALGLDYDGKTFLQQAKDGSFEVKDTEAFYLEYSGKSNLREAAKIPVASDIYHRVAQLAESDPTAASVMKNMRPTDMHSGRSQGDHLNPYTGKGNPAAGERLGVGKGSGIGQEMEITKPQDMPKGAKMWRMDANGKPKLYARWNGEAWEQTKTAKGDSKFVPPPDKE